METATRQIEEDNKKLNVIGIREKEARNNYNAAKDNLDSMAYINYFNNVRSHQKLSMKTPSEKEQEYYTK